MKFRFYAYSYNYGWELYTIIHKEENIQSIINNLDQYKYAQYIIVKETDRDEVYKIGFFQKPKTLKNKR